MNQKNKLPNYGGQAVMEGVMMRGKKNMAVSVRAADGSIRTQVRPLSRIYSSRIASIPFLRGTILLWDTFGTGLESLNIAIESQGEETLTKKEIAGSMLFAIVIALGVFFVLPIWIATGISSALHWSELGTNLLEGVIRLVFLIGYLVGVGRVPEFDRIFAYHGAEHRTVHAFEAGAELTPESVDRFPSEHPRCGTSFLVVLVIVAIFLFALLGPMPLGWKILVRLVSIPVLIGFGYEYLRVMARWQDSIIGKILSLPGLWTQRLTTRKPDRSMLEVAIAAFQAMRQAEEGIPFVEPEPAVDPQGA
jgi:uncharacterized protein YqhQ